MAKVILAYSGALDTSICLYWLRNVRGDRVYTFSANIGQFEYLEPLAEKAITMGAVAAHIADLRERFLLEFVFPALKAQAEYGEGYHLFSALSRPLIAQELVNIAKEEGCEIIAHGSRGLGNDTIRFQRCISALAPELRVVLPLQELSLRGAEEDIHYAYKHNIKVESLRKTIYNVEQNLWGVNIQVRQSDLWQEPPKDTYFMTSPISEAPLRPTVIELEFERGIPVGLNGERLGPVQLVERLNRVGGRNAIGRRDMVEDRIRGIKTREIYEAPAATILHTAHRALEGIVLDKQVLQIRQDLSRQYANLVYDGNWFSQSREALDAFFDQIQQRVTGAVRLQLLQGHLSVIGRRSAYSLYKPALRIPAEST
jgi:argininosuccinate synthase